MSLRKTDIGLAWSAGCSLLTPGLDQTLYFTDGENTVGSYLKKLEPSSLQAKARSKIKSPRKEREVHRTFRADGFILSHQQQR